MSIRILFLFIFISLIFSVAGQKPVDPFHRCMVALTYDDGSVDQLNNVVPLLDSLGLKATFYIHGNAETLKSRQPEWRRVAKNGHELGNHTLFHPCEGTVNYRPWLNKAYDLHDYSVSRIIDEIRLANTLLSAIDGKLTRSFAYTCGDTKVGDTSFVELIRDDFIAARGTTPGTNNPDSADLFNLCSYGVNGMNADQLIGLVKKAQQEKRFIVFLCHKVGGMAERDISIEDHRKLLIYLKSQEKDIWVAPLAEIAGYIKTNRK